MKRHLFRRMGRFLRPQAPSLAGAAALAALSGLLALLVPLVAGWAVEAIGTGPGAADLTAVLRYCAAGLGAAVLSAVCSYGASAALVRVGQTVSYTLRKAAFQQITQLPVRYFDTHPAGDLISRVCYDVDTVNAALSTDLLQIGTSLLTVIGSFVMLLMLSPLLSGVFFLTVPLSVLLTRLQMKHIHPLFRRRSQELGALNSFAEERVSCQRAIRVYGVEAADLRQFAEKNDAASETYYKADCASTALGPSVNFINNLSLAAVSVFGALLYLGGGLSLGALSSFVLYSRKFSGPIRETAELLSDLQASVAAAERVLDLLDQPAEDGDLPGAREPCKLSGAISFRHVDFGYDPAHPVLRDFSADIPAGSMVAVVGPTGAGKTTLVSLLLRFYTPQSGTITIDGLPIQQYTRDGLRRRLAIVLQDGWLCGGTIAENIAYGVPGATRAQIEAAPKPRISRDPLGKAYLQPRHRAAQPVEKGIRRPLLQSDLPRRKGDALCQQGKAARRLCHRHGVPQGHGLHHHPHVVIAVCTPPQNIQSQVDLGRGLQRQSLHRTTSRGPPPAVWVQYSTSLPK